ncbi:MAG: phosphotransferase [Methyloglobulus sp.]|nr:phosphotransferase [Methyloglobulus sp.]
MISDDFRKINLLDWLKNDLLLSINSCEPASSDASFRRYFRVSLADRQLIVMDAPPDKENIASFIKVAGLMAHANVKVPAIYYENRKDGFLVLEDFGGYCLLDKLNEGTVKALYRSALDCLLTLQTNTSASEVNLPRYDETLLQKELEIFEAWFINQAWGIEIPASVWNPVRNLLVSSALEQPVTCVHRDYHSRNLMVLPDTSLGVIDFQDAVIGPITYDLVSLLRDCYIAWPHHHVEKWVMEHYRNLKKADLVTCDLSQFTRWFDLMGLQRHLKAIGIFARLYLRDGKTGYLKDIPRTLSYVLTQTKAYPELSEFHDFLKHHIVPKYPGLK